jgi:hypothetical protein
MSQPTSLPPAFDGMVQDFPRNNLPKGKCWNLVDYIPEGLGAPATERGGWAFLSAALTVVDASATYVKAMLNAPFNAGTQLLVIDDNAKLIKVVAGVNTLISGTANKPVQNPFMHQQLVVIPSPDGSTASQKYDGTTLAGLSGSAPPGRYGCVFVNFSYLGGTAAQPQRGYASAVGDPTTYVQSGVDASYLDVSFPIRAMAALPNVMLWFGDERTARFRGTTPSGVAEDMQLDDPVFNYGTLDARSVAVNGGLAVFANAIGVFLTNGTTTPEDLTKSCGISKYWRDLVSAANGYSASTWTISSGWFGSIVLVCVMNGSTLVDTIAFDTVKRSVIRFSNLKTQAFAAAGSAGQELYAGGRATPRVMQLSTMWTPGSSYKNDGDGTPVLGVWESPFYDTQRVGSQRWHDLYPDYDLRDAASDDPTMTYAYCTSPEAGAAYTTLSPVAGETTKRTTTRIPIRMKNRGLGFKVTRQNAASFARMYGLGATVYSREGSRLDA